MDLQTGLIYVGAVVISAAVILLVSMFGIKEKSYEEAIAEQRKLPDDLLLGKKDKGKEKKHKNKTGKKVKEKKDEKDEKVDGKEEKSEHVQFEEIPQILSSETQSQKENLSSVAQSEPMINKSPKETPTKLKKNAAKEANKKKDEEKKEVDKINANTNALTNINSNLIINTNTTNPSVNPGIQQVSKELNKETKELQKESTTVLTPLSANKESKKNKKKYDILAQIGGDKDGVNVSLLMPLVQKAELSRSEIQILIDQLLNKQLDNPMEHSEWTEGRADPVIKLKKQLAEKEKALAEEHEASVTFQNKLKELRGEWNLERSRLTNNLKQLEEAHNNKIAEAQTLHTRMQHILESHAAEKQGLLRQREQLQAKINEDAAIIHKMQEDKGQSQGHLQQELVAQRKQLEVQFGQMRDNENALKQQLAQKHIEIQELQNVNMNVTQELQATCESSSAEIEILRQQLSIIQEQFMHSEGQLQHLKDANDRYQDMVRQLDESHRSHADMEHRLKQSHRHEQELQKQIHTQQNELKVVKNEAATLNNELMKLKSEFSQSQNEAKSETMEINNLKTLLANKDDELKNVKNDLNKSQSDIKKLEVTLNDARNELNNMLAELVKSQDQVKNDEEKLVKMQDELNKTSVYVNTINQTNNELELVKAQLEKFKNSEKNNSNEANLKINKLQEENDCLSVKINKLPELQKELKKLKDENKSLSTQLSNIIDKVAAEGRENGVDDNKNNSNEENQERDYLLLNKNRLISELELEVKSSLLERNQYKFQWDTLRKDFLNKIETEKQLQSELEAQRSKNNELRSRNWKVMEALSIAESRLKSGNNVNEDVDKAKKAEQELTKSFLMRLFPDVKISEKSYDKWLNKFEEHVNAVINDMKNKIEDLEKQNKNLQRVVAHYKQIIDETEGMLNNLQHHVESAESRWQSELRQKESENVSLQLELNQLKTRTSVHDKTEINKESINKANENFLQHEKNLVSSPESKNVRLKQENSGAVSNSDANGPAASDTLNSEVGSEKK